MIQIFLMNIRRVIINRYSLEVVISVSFESKRNPGVGYKFASKIFDRIGFRESRDPFINGYC